ncbi:MAG: ATP-binding protein [Nitrospirota bacterium]
MRKTIFSQIEEGIKGGKTAFILEFNTNDRQLLLEKGIYPTSLHLALATYFAQNGYHCGLYSPGIGGVQELNPPGITQTRPNPFRQQGSNRSLNLYTPILRNREAKVVLIVQYADLLAPVAEGSIFLQPEQQIVLETLHRWGADDAIRQAQNIVILISYEGGVNSLLTRSGVYQTIQVPLPEETTRQEFINLLLKTQEGANKRYAAIEDGFTTEEMSRVSNGLRLIDIETLFRSRVESVVTRNDVQAIKSNAIRDMAGGLVEVVEPDEGFESIAGLESVKEYFQFLKWMFQNGSPAVPYAMILAGVPGSGKSKLCSTLAKELNLPLLILRNLHGPFVGQSETNLERVLRIVESMSPCVVLIEEIDQGIGQRGTGLSGDSGTTNRMSQRFWEALGSSQKNRGRNLWIGTSNRPDLLDTAMLDRFQVIIPFLHPMPKEVAVLLPVIASQIKRELAKDVDLVSISNMPNLYLPTVRGLVEIITSAAQRADYESGEINSIIQNRHLLAAAQDYKITYDTVQHEYIALKAVEMVSFSSLLPWMTFNGKRPDAEIPSYLQEIVDPDGYVDSSKLSARIRELEQVLYAQKIMR